MTTPRRNRVDLHCHTARSDGLLEPLDLYAQLRAAGTTLVAITDHDTLAGVRELHAAGLGRADSSDGPRILHKLIAYIPQRRRLRERWVEAMQRGEVPLRVIDGEIDPISGAHMVERYQQLVPHADTVLLANIGHYPQIEAPVQVLKHYLAFRERIGQAAPRRAYS